MCDIYIIIITFWRETSKSLPFEEKDRHKILDRWLLKTHYNHQLKKNITAKRSYQSGRRGCGWVGGDTGGIFLFELKYVMVFRNTGFNLLIHMFIYFLIYSFFSLSWF